MAKMIGNSLYTCGHGKACVCNEIDPRTRRMLKKRQKRIEIRREMKEN